MLSRHAGRRGEGEKDCEEGGGGGGGGGGPGGGGGGGAGGGGGGGKSHRWDLSGLEPTQQNATPGTGLLSPDLASSS